MAPSLRGSVNELPCPCGAGCEGCNAWAAANAVSVRRQPPAPGGGVVLLKVLEVRDGGGTEG